MRTLGYTAAVTIAAAGAALGLVAIKSLPDVLADISGSGAKSGDGVMSAAVAAPADSNDFPGMAAIPGLPLSSP